MLAWMIPPGAIGPGVRHSWPRSRYSRAPGGPGGVWSHSTLTPDRILMLDRPLSTVADIVQSDGVAFDGKQDAKDATAATINHLAKCDA
jgi:hypothetical protein